MYPITLRKAGQRHHEVILERPDAAPDLKIELQFAFELCITDVDTYRRAQQKRTQHSQ